MASSKKTMREVIVSKGPETKLVDSPIPTPEAGHVLIKVVVSGSNPKDWKMPEWTDTSSNTGDDVAGIVAGVGDGVYEFATGDRVAAFHEILAPAGGFAEYAVAPATTTLRLPERTSFEEGAAVPLAALTAALSLYGNMQLPAPWIGGAAKKPTPLLIYGASSAVGSYALQFARRSKIHPIIAVAGRARDHVERFLDPSQGDTFVDYRMGVEGMVKEINAALKGQPLLFASDCISEGDSYKVVGAVLSKPGGTFTTVLPIPDEAVPEGVTKIDTRVNEIQKNHEDLAYVYTRYISKGLHDGWFKGQPHQVVPGGLEGVGKALKDLKDGKASAVKYVFRIADTPGIES